MLIGDGYTDRWTRAMYGPEFGAAERRERCWACNRAFPADEMTQTPDGPECAPCLAVSISEAAADLAELSCAASADIARGIIREAQL